jgi:hypothetical protein
MRLTASRRKSHSAGFAAAHVRRCGFFLVPKLRAWECTCTVEAPAYELIAPLSEDRRKFITYVSAAAHTLTVRRRWADDKQQLKLPPDSAATLFGSLTAVETSKTDSWSLYYSTGMQNFVIHLDAVSGKVLYIYSIPEG